MSETRPPWYDRPLNATIVGGIVTAFLIWFVPWAFGLATTAKVPLWAYVLVGVVALLVFSVVIPPWRHAVWGTARRVLKWLWSWHPVSARRHMASREADSDQIDAFLQRQLPAIVRKIVKDENEPQENLREISKALAEQIVKAQKAAGAAVQAAAAAGSTGAASPPSLPLPDPRWEIEHNYSDFEKGDKDFIITNHVPRSVAKEVRVEGTQDESGYVGIRILDAGHFEDLSGKATGEFRAEFDQESRWSGGTFAISWYDETARKRWEQIYVPGWETRPPQPHPQSPYTDETPF